MPVFSHQRRKRSLPAQLWRGVRFLTLLLVPLTLLAACRGDSNQSAFSIENVLYGVAALSPTDAWAVGTMSSLANPHIRNQVLIEHWNGEEWQVVPSSSAGILSGVAAVAANDAWAVGQANSIPLMLHWDGASWSPVPGPNFTSVGALSGVAAVTAHDVWAVGGTSQF